ncbi:N-acetylmuramoyl-L-alanine amidase [Parapedobacter sp. ISTM3]|uniref:N-acetylmuramoyl-L-alanine amidase n=1 Tax=Parapedobacter luteus TaxID=623280 RepID=A0A1T5AL34_9SPHI|nr:MULTISPECIES: N-acetylmuramoyl-L-alanine amidase [Parapedobacter]MBK1441701.1 N-acetylmuramoyl-L-alanine amidase [Parapedobacter sp. ISTM3]SKB35694.1 N-acetylmuramoyl-L-alanine amidase [Parapedobacter luteus]
MIKHPTKQVLYFISLFIFIPTISFANKYQDTAYTVRTIVLDAGHGGDKPGARGATSLEKNIALQVALKLGKAIESEIPGVKVHYTRTTDVDVELYKRIEFANAKKADLFISIHCNAAPARRVRMRNSKGKYYYTTVQNKQIRGTETFVSGFGRLDEQEVALRENADILLEENYEENYQGFDPNDPESFIVFSLMKNQFREQSIRLASFIQQQYVKSGREDRGVQELSLAVLARAGMPAVLTEIGFISNPDEETYMKSESGQAEIVKNLLEAIKAYKRQVEH